MSITEIEHEAHQSKRECVYTNARIVTETEVFLGTLEVKAGNIVSIERGNTRTASALDFDGDYLLPGFIDVHTDHLEKYAMPRSGVFWPPAPAVLAYDAVVAAAGVTTVFDSLCVGAVGKPYRKKMLPMMLEGIRSTRDAGLLRSDHYLHLRCDVLDPELEQAVDTFITDPKLRFITVMDDSAGRRSIEYYRKVQRERGPISEAELDERVRLSLANDQAIAEQVRRWLVKVARSHNVAIANHDDTRAAHIDEATRLGMSILEFAITEEAAEAAHAAGMTIIAGAPNVVNGGSHFGNVSAAHLATRGMVSILCSDYVPVSLGQAAFILSELENGPSLPQAVAMISTNPAKTFGFEDRGSLAVGKRADMVRASKVGRVPVVSAVWREGVRVI